LPAAFEPAIVIDPMTSQRRGWNPAPALRAAKTRKVVIGRGLVEKLGPARRSAPQVAESANAEIYKSGFCEFFEHRSPPLPLFRGLDGERDGQPGATITPRAAKAVAIDPDILRHRWPEPDRRVTVPKLVLPMCSSLGLKGVSNEMSATSVGK
jgi:hypothetical protein